MLHARVDVHSAARCAVCRWGCDLHCKPSATVVLHVAAVVRSQRSELFTSWGCDSSIVFQFGFTKVNLTLAKKGALVLNRRFRQTQTDCVARYTVCDNAVTTKNKRRFLFSERRKITGKPGNYYTILAEMTTDSSSFIFFFYHCQIL